MGQRTCRQNTILMNTGHTRFSRNLWTTVALLFALACAIVLYMVLEQRVGQANERRLQSLLLANELRQSSDDLTRMARTFVVTGEPRYQQYYQDILDIRNGKKPRPLDYHKVYWDLVTPQGVAPRPAGGQSIALLDLMRQAGFSAEEFRKLEEAKANSDGLTAPSTRRWRSCRPPVRRRRRTRRGHAA